MDDCSAVGEGDTAVVVVDATDDGAAGTSMPVRSQGFGGEGIVKFEDVAGDKDKLSIHGFTLFVQQLNNRIIKCTNSNKQKASRSRKSSKKRGESESPTQNKLNPILQVQRQRQHRHRHQHQHSTYKNPLSCNNLAIFSSSLSRGSRSKLSCQKSGALSKLARLSSIKVRMD